MPPDPDDGWAGYRRVVLQSFEQVREDIKRLEIKLDVLRNSEISSMRVDIAMLQVRAGMWGTAGGAVGGAIIAALVGKWLH